MKLVLKPNKQESHIDSLIVVKYIIYFMWMFLNEPFPLDALSVLFSDGM